MQTTQTSSFQFMNPTISRVPANKSQVDKPRAAMERMELYFIAHPGSPSAVRRPQLLCRGGVWIALLGTSVTDGIAGFGASVESALRAFDAQYVRGLRPPEALADQTAQQPAQWA